MLRLTIDIPPASQATLRRLISLPAITPSVIARTMDRENQITVGHIQRDKLSQRGPLTLGVVTNRLRGSIRASKAQIDNSGSKAVIVSSIGTNVIYAGVHEYGFRGRVTVRAHTREGFTVRQHMRQMNVKERAPIRTGVRERLPAVSEAIADAVVKHAVGKGEP